MQHLFSLKWQYLLLETALALVATAISFAYPTGISGRTLKGPNPGCSCHGTQSPSFSVVIKAPAAMVVSQAALCTVTVAGTATGVDISTSNGTLSPVSGSLHVLNGELAHSAATNPGVYIFTYTAPATAGTQTLYATGVPSYPGNWNHAANVQITVSPAIPPTPSLLLPTNGASNQPLAVTTSWNISAGASAYRLQIATDSLFGSVFFDDSTITGTSNTLSGLGGGASYYWHVRARNGAGSSAWSPIWNFTTSNQTSRQYSVVGGWNMIAVPLAIPDMLKTHVYSTSTSAAYAFSGTQGYTQKDTLLNGTGYWLKFGGAESITLTGLQISRDTLTIAPGWNLIGSISTALDTASVVQIPPGIILSVYYGYNNGYLASDSLRPGRSYWVKSSSVGQLILR